MLGHRCRHGRRRVCSHTGCIVAWCHRRRRRATVASSRFTMLIGRSSREALKFTTPPAPTSARGPPLHTDERVSLYLLILLASLTGLPALLTGAAPVSRVCQVFGLAKRFPSLPPCVLQVFTKTDRPPKSKPKTKRLLRHMTLSVRRLCVVT